MICLTRILDTVSKSVCYWNQRILQLPIFCGSNGFEADNDAQDQQISLFTIYFTNVTIIGPKQDSTTVINSNYKEVFT